MAARTKLVWTQDGERKSESFNSEAKAYERMCELWGKGVRDAKIEGNEYYGL